MFKRSPRLQVCLKQETYDTVVRLAALQDQSASSLLREMIELVAPQLERMAELLEAFAAQRAQIGFDSSEAGENARQYLLDILDSVEDPEPLTRLREFMSENAPADDLRGDGAPGDAEEPSGKAHVLIGALKPPSSSSSPLSSSPPLSSDDRNGVS